MDPRDEKIGDSADAEDTSAYEEHPDTLLGVADFSQTHSAGDAWHVGAYEDCAKCHPGAGEGA